MHCSDSTVLQDSFAFGTDKNEKWLIAAVSDGVSEDSHSHLLADYLTRQTVVILKDKLSGIDDIEKADWKEITEQIRKKSYDFCKKQNDKNRNCSATLEFVVVKLNCVKASPFVAVTVAGDGAVYKISKNIFETVKFTPKNKGGVASNEVEPLPYYKGNAEIHSGSLGKGDVLFITTDGLSDRIGGNGNNSALGNFLIEKFPECKNMISFLQVMDVYMYQTNDDRTGILIRRDKNED